MIILTDLGPAQVLHRLALGVEVVDVVSRRLAAEQLRVGREVSTLTLPDRFDRSWPCLGLPSSGFGRFRLRHLPSGQDPSALPDLPATLTVRVDDPSRRFVPRRFRERLWTRQEVAAPDARPPGGAYLPARARLLRPWLLPGSAYPLARGVTALRGRVVRAGSPVRWPRVLAIGPGNAVVGWAHGDERGEFLLVVTDTGTLPPPAPSTLGIDLQISAMNPATAPPVDPDDRCADLVVERVPRSTAPPLPAELDNNQLRGLSRPPDYIVSTAARPHLTLQVGELLTVRQPVVFAV